MCKVVLLDGASSAGKTSLAVAFQDLVTDQIVYRHSLDDFLDSLPPWFMDEILRSGDKDGLNSSLSKFHRMPSCMASRDMPSTRTRLRMVISRSDGRQGAMVNPQLPITTVVTPSAGDGLSMGSQVICAS